MPVDNHREPPSENNRSTSQPARARRKFVSRRNAIIAGIGLVCALVALVLVGLIAYRLGYVDRYIAGQIKGTLSNYGVRAEIRSFHTSFSPQTVELQGVELYDAKTGEKLGKIDRILATVRIEDLFALNLRRNINLKDLKLEGLELWVSFDAEGRSNFRNIHVPPPEPNARILFAYSTAHVEITNSQIHYGDVLHNLSGEARNMHLIVQPDDLNAPAASWMNAVTFTSSNSTFVYDGKTVNNIEIDARARVNQTRAEIQGLTLRSPFAEAHLEGVMDDWRNLKYKLNVTSTVDLTQASDILQPGTTLRGTGNFVGTVTGDGNRYEVDGSIKSDALAADGLRLQALNVSAKGSGQGASYDFNGKAVAELLSAGDFQLNTVQLTGGVMGTGADFRWIGELRAAAAKGYGTTIAGLILRDARAESRDGELTVSAPQFSANSLTTSTARVQNGIQANDLRMTSRNGKTSATIATAKAGKIQLKDATINGVTAKAIDIKNDGNVTNVTVQQVQVGEVNASGAQTGSINIAGVRLAVRNGRVEGTTSDINAGNVKLKDGSIESVKLARPTFTVEPSGRYRASADLSLGGGVMGQMKLGPARAAVVATSDQIQLNNFVAEAMDGRASGNATISLRKNGASVINADFNNIDVGGLMALAAGRAIPISSKATGKANLTFTDSDLTNATGTVTAELVGAPNAAGQTPLAGEIAVSANHGVFQVQRANLQTPATTLTASGQLSIEQPISNLLVNVNSTDASELQRLLLSSGVLPDLDEQFRTYGIDLGGKLAFNGSLTGKIKDPIVNGHAELGSLSVNQRELGSLSANISSTATETRVTEGRLAQTTGGGAQFSLVVPRTGENNASIDAALDRMNLGNLLAALPFTTQTREQLGDTQGEVSGTVKISGMPDAMSGVADIRSSQGRLAGEPLQGLTAHATFTGSSVDVDKVDLNFNAGHLIASGKYDLKTKAFDLTASGDRVQLERLQAFANRPNLPKLAGTATIKNLHATGVYAGSDLSKYVISFDAESGDVTLNGKPAGAVSIVGRTENKQLNVTLTSTSLLGDQPQSVVARVDLSQENLPAVIESTITGADITQLLRIFVPSDVLVNGRATGTLKLAGDLLDEDGYPTIHGLVGNATFSELSINIGEPGQQINLTTAEPVIVEVTPNEVIFHDSHFTGTQTNVTLGGALATTTGGRNTLAINGTVNLRVLSLFSPDLFSSGIARLDVNVGGTYENMRVTGQASVANATVSVYLGDERIALSNLQGSILFNAHQAQIDRALEGTIGGGRFTVTGGAQLDGFKIAQFLFNVTGTSLTLNYPQDFRSTVDATLEVRGTPEVQFISGDVRVRRAEYTKDIELAELINQRPQPTIEEGSEFTFAQTANFDKLRVEGRNALIMRNNIGDVVASLSVQVDGPVKNPIIQGRITATRGTLNFRNNPYEITRGLVYLPARLDADPILNIEAQSVIRGYRVTAMIEGPLSHPTTSVGAEPSLPQADVVSLILTGTLTSTETNTSVLAQSGLGTAASLLTDALINAPISKATNKLFGLSRLEINPVISSTNSAPTARLTAARRITKDLTVTYSTNIASDPNQVLTVEYRVSNRMSFVAQYEQGSNRNLATRNNNYSFEIRFRKRF